MEKNPSILRFGSLSVKVITRFSKEEASSYALLARWRRPRKHSTTTLATGASPRWSGKTTMETRRRCRPLDLHRYLKIDTLLSFCTCKFCQPFSCWKSVPLNVFRLRNEVIPNARLTLVERSLPLSPQLREVLSRRCSILTPSWEALNFMSGDSGGKGGTGQWQWLGIWVWGQMGRGG